MRALLGLLLAALPVIAAEPVPPPPPAVDPLALPEEQRAFFQDGPGLLLTEKQRVEFLWNTDAGRRRLIDKFWERDPVPETPENELRLGIEKRRRLALLHFPSPLDVRWQILFLRGLPTERRQVTCRALNPLEIWEYGPGQPPLVIYQPLPRTLPSPTSRLWWPEDTLIVLYDAYLLPNSLPKKGEALAAELQKLGRSARATCPAFTEVERATGAAAGSDSREARKTQDFELPEDRVWSVLRPADLAAWSRAAAATAVTLPPPLATGAVELDFPRTLGEQLTVRALLPVSSTGSGARIIVSALTEGEGKVLDEYRAVYRLPEGGRGGEAVPLLLERQVPPGLPFLLRLRVRDEATGAEALVTRSAVAPSMPEARDPEVVRAAVLGMPLLLGDWVGPDSLLLPPPPERAAPGIWRVEPMITGRRITRVVYRVDGQVWTTLDRSPFAADVLLTGEAREQVIRAEGYDEDNLLVAVDEVAVPGEQREQEGSGARPFRADLETPAPVRAGGGTVLARASVSVPEGRRVETVEIRLNDAPVTTLTAPPWEARVDVPASEPMVYLSAVARLDDGSQAEDVHFLRAPDNLQEIDVRLVELYATVTDRSDRPVADLRERDFEILEEGRPQALARFERVQDLSLNLGLVIDSSHSMTESIAETQRAAAGFLSRLIRPQDRSFVIGLAARPYLLFAPTNDAAAMAKASLPELRARGGTALYDSLATAVLLLREGRGQRAIVLLSDGGDSLSHATLQQAVDLARQGGVTIYAIGLGVRTPAAPLVAVGAPLSHEQQARQLERMTERRPRARHTPLDDLAQETGGRVFYIDKAKELEEVYGQIEEDLRSRYLLAYQTERGEDPGDPSVEVRVKKRGLKARTARGYYP
ncbi:MAG TPA: VWA domain-containing protein [Thermoanaerobaculia bacterium]|nr:VWA domain-containing protein [Thermoanaerobaculia bacterium]